MPLRHRDLAHAACIPTGQICPSKKARGKKGKKLSCTQCCRGAFVLDASGKKVCGCLVNGATCTTDRAASCCSGFCGGGTCHAAPCSEALPCPGCQTCGADGLCAPLADGTSCNVPDLCTPGQTCSSGVCQGGTPVTCPASDQCHLPGTCDPATGTCSNPAKPDGMSCNNGNPCTVGDTCQSGVCVSGRLKTCNAPPDDCHVGPGTCVMATGQCDYPLAENRTHCGSGSGQCCNGTCCTGCCSTNDSTGGTCGVCRVFVTSLDYTGNLKGANATGLDGADAICRAHADSALGGPLPGTYKAWLSTDNTGPHSPAVRFRFSSTPYVLVDNDQTQIADNFQDLFNCSVNECLDHAIDVNENGAQISPSRVWTNTEFSGFRHGGNHCGNWEIDNNSAAGSLGITDRRDPGWTTFDLLTCDLPQRLYCFQQD